MPASSHPQLQHAHSVDALFAHINDEHVSGPGSYVPAGRVPATRVARPAASADAAAGVQPPPRLERPEDLRAAHAWLQKERQRLDEYTRSQFETIQSQHEALLAKHFRGEQNLAVRSQELNRELQFL